VFRARIARMRSAVRPDPGRGSTPRSGGRVGLGRPEHRRRKLGARRCVRRAPGQRHARPQVGA